MKAISHKKDITIVIYSPYYIIYQNYTLNTFLLYILLISMYVVYFYLSFYQIIIIQKNNGKERNKYDNKNWAMDAFSEQKTLHCVAKNAIATLISGDGKYYFYYCCLWILLLNYV